MANAKDPITKVYLVYFKADNSKEELEFQKELDANPKITRWIKHLMLISDRSKYE
jgi:hypothetical protein